MKRLILAASVLVLLSACGPTVKISSLQTSPVPSTLVVLPIINNGEIPEARVATIKRAVENELRNAQYNLVDSHIVNDICSTPQCPERKIFAEKYLVDGFVTLQLDSLSRNNFLLGYFNYLSGELFVRDKDDTELVSVSLSERERGGVLFESGQVIQGIISQVNNGGDAAFNKLASKFALSLVGALPVNSEPLLAVRAIPEGNEIALNKVTSERLPSGDFKVCASGTPDSFAYLILGNERSALRETSHGTYCSMLGALNIPETPTEYSVELRSIFGNSVRQPLALSLRAPCDIGTRISESENSKGLALELKCTSFGSSYANAIGCTPDIAPCAVTKVSVYRSATTNGVFQKFADFKGARAIVPNKSEIAIVAFSDTGLPSLPVILGEERK